MLQKLRIFSFYLRQLTKNIDFSFRLLTLKDAKKGHRALLAKINVLSTNNRAIVFHSIGRKIYSVAEKGVTDKQQKVKSEKYTVLYAQALALLHLIEKNCKITLRTSYGTALFDCTSDISIFSKCFFSFT